MKSEFWSHWNKTLSDRRVVGASHRLSPTLTTHSSAQEPLDTESSERNKWPDVVQQVTEPESDAFSMQSSNRSAATSQLNQKLNQDAQPEEEKMFWEEAAPRGTRLYY